MRRSCSVMGLIILMGCDSEARPGRKSHADHADYADFGLREQYRGSPATTATLRHGPQKAAGQERTETPRPPRIDKE